MTLREQIADRIAKLHADEAEARAEFAEMIRQYESSPAWARLSPAAV